MPYKDLEGITGNSFGFDKGQGPIIKNNSDVVEIKNKTDDAYAAIKSTHVVIDPKEYSGAPTTGTWEKGTIVTDSDGINWKCTVSGTPGTWVVFLADAPADDKYYVRRNGLWVESGLSIPVTVNGFTDKSQSTMSFTLATRTFTISPVSTSFSYYNISVLYTKSSPESIVLSNTVFGRYFIYYYHGTLLCSVVNTPWDFDLHTPVAVIYYNPSAAAAPWGGPNYTMLDERHGKEITTAAHRAMHYGVGVVAADSGMTITGNYVAGSGVGSLSANSFGISTGKICDEDLIFTLSALADNEGTVLQYPVFYRWGANNEWRWKVEILPYLFGTNQYYNQNIAGSWQLTDVPSANFTNFYIFATNSYNPTYRFIILMPQTQYSTLLTADAEDPVALLNFVGFPFTEAMPLYRLMLKRTTGGAAFGNCRIEQFKYIKYSPLGRLVTLQNG